MTAKTDYQPHPEWPWIEVRRPRLSEVSWVRAGPLRRSCFDEECIQRFALETSESSTHLPIGTVIHRLLTRLGKQPCAACIRRIHKLNHLVHRGRR
jgi:hypothetical protein